jgi:hypothetical protein
VFFRNIPPVKLETDKKKTNMKLTQSLANRLVTSVAVSVAVLLTANLFAQEQAGRAEVRAVRGAATYTLAGGPPTPLKVGTVLTSGAVVKTGPEASADLFLGNTAGLLRLTENTTLGLDKLTLTDTGAETVVDVQVNLPEGTVLGNVNKLSPASKYEIKLPNGVTGVRGGGARFRVASTYYIVLLNGTMIAVFVPPGGPPQPYTLMAPPAVYFSPVEGIRQAPDDLIREVLGQFGQAMLPELPRPEMQVDKTIDDGYFVTPVLIEDLPPLTPDQPIN